MRIELHTHILPGIDDGAKTKAESFELLDDCKRQGIYTAVMTPHFYPGDQSMKDFLKKREAAFQSISDYEGVKLLRGSETLMSELLFNYSSLDELCIEGTNYLLLEMSYHSKWSDTLFDSIGRLMDRYEIIPIIAHVERYEPIKKYYKMVQEFRDMGCLIQMNGGSLIPKWSRIFCFKLLRRGWIDVIASDCHNMTTRRPVYREAMKIIEDKLGVDYVDALEDCAYSIVYSSKEVQRNR